MPIFVTVISKNQTTMKMKKIFKTMLAIALVGVFAVFAAALIIISIYYLFKYRKENGVLFITYITWWLSYLYLNISMPYSCSMNARYMLIPLIIGFVMIGKGFEKEESKLIKGITILSTALVCIYSIVYFIFESHAVSTVDFGFDFIC